VASLLLANVAGLIFGVLLVPLMLFLLVTRLGLLYPRLGRWIDRRAYRAMPRLGHLFMSDEEVSEERLREERRREQRLREQLETADGKAGPAGSSSSSAAAENAFGEREGR
jgi:hypothetical protein